MYYVTFGTSYIDGKANAFRIPWAPISWARMLALPCPIHKKLLVYMVARGD